MLTIEESDKRNDVKDRIKEREQSAPDRNLIAASVIISDSLQQPLVTQYCEEYHFFSRLKRFFLTCGRSSVESYLFINCLSRNSVLLKVEDVCKICDLTYF